MTLILAEWIVRAGLAYSAVGVLFLVPFLLRGAGRIDPVARGGSIGFKLLIAPGVVALWPVLLGRWLKAGASR